MIETCASFFRFGYESGGDRKADDFTWADYFEYNKHIDWAGWNAPDLR